MAYDIAVITSAIAACAGCYCLWRSRKMKPAQPRSANLRSLTVLYLFLAASLLSNGVATNNERAESVRLLQTRLDDLKSRLQSLEAVANIDARDSDLRDDIQAVEARIQRFSSREPFLPQLPWRMIASFSLGCMVVNLVAMALKTDRHRQAVSG